MANFSESATSARKLRGAERREQALRLRIAGRTYPEIAAELGMSRAGAHKTVTVALAALRAQCNESAEQMRTLETERLVGIIRDADEILRSPETGEAGRLRALELKVKASESLRKLWGLDAPTKIAPTTPDGDEEYGGLSDDQRAAAIAGLLAAARARATGQPTDGGEPAL